MWINKRQYEDLLLSHKREVDILTSWVEHLQLQIQSPMASPRELPPPGPVDMKMYMGDDESDLQDAFDQGIIDKPALDAALAQLRQADLIVT
jgi:hypothetical protein